MLELNYLAILVAAIVSFVIGWAWFSPVLFMKQWIALSGVTPEKVEVGGKQKMMQSMVIMFVLVLISAYVLAYFVHALGVTTVLEAVRLAIWVWLGFMATIQLGPFLWEGKPFKLSLLQGGQTLVTTLAMAIILALWQ